MIKSNWRRCRSCLRHQQVARADTHGSVAASSVSADTFYIQTHLSILDVTWRRDGPAGVEPLPEQSQWLRSLSASVPDPRRNPANRAEMGGCLSSDLPHAGAREGFGQTPLQSVARSPSVFGFLIGQCCWSVRILRLTATQWRAGFPRNRYATSSSLPSRMR